MPCLESTNPSPGLAFAMLPLNPGLHMSHCRSHDKGVTIQGAISAASAVATAACQAKEFPLPQTMLLQCPASVRKQVRPLP